MDSTDVSRTPAQSNFSMRKVIVLFIVFFLSFSDISKEMAIDSYDIVSTLQALGMMKYWKGKHIILKKQVSLSFVILK